VVYAGYMQGGGTLWYMLGMVGWYPHGGVYAPCILPGTPHQHPLHAEHRHRYTGWSCTVHQAQEWRKAWVRTSLSPPGSKSVSLPMGFFPGTLSAER